MKSKSNWLKASLWHGRIGWGLLALSGALALSAPLAHAQRVNPTAQAESALKAELTQHIVLVEKGKEVLKPVESVKPGDLIEYRVTYTNRDGQPVRDVQADLPIPQGMEYQPKTAQPAQTAQASTDGVTFAREPLMRTGASGKPEPVPYSEYRRLRWQLGQIAAGAKTEVVVRARVSSGTPAANSLGVSSAATAAVGR